MSTIASDRADFDLHNIEEEDHWISVSDLMAGLMMVFLFISIALMKSAFDERDNFKEMADVYQIERDMIKEIAVAYQENQVAIYDALMEEFKDDLEEWDAAIDQATLSFEFRSPDVLFGRGDIGLKPAFKEILDDFFPRYLSILGEFTDSISEVRIEGHTSSVWNQSTTEDTAYFNNMNLSQGRTRAVLEYVYQLPELREKKSWVKEHIAAVGLSSSHLVWTAEGAEDREKSRRVNFRAITNADLQIRKILEN
jgi:outer membrane protein OmpA-like peptidoglycan-associated protein